MGNPRGAVEDITNRLDQMNMDMMDVVMDIQNSSQELTNNRRANIINQNSLGSIDQEDANFYNACNALMEQGESLALDQLDNSQRKNLESNQQNLSNILIVTNLDPNIFIDKQLQAEFESLFRIYDSEVTFRYLKSFKRVRLDFSDPFSAEEARSNLSHYLLGNNLFRCYTAQIIKPNYLSGEDAYQNSIHLKIPKQTKQFLISPPASPPAGWEPITESPPVIDVQLISAIANLVPGQTHELHAGNESQPGICVEVCEDPQFEDPTLRSCSRIPRTMSPAYCKQDS